VTRVHRSPRQVGAVTATPWPTRVLAHVAELQTPRCGHRDPDRGRSAGRAVKPRGRTRPRATPENTIWASRRPGSPAPRLLTTNTLRARVPGTGVEVSPSLPSIQTPGQAGHRHPCAHRRRVEAKRDRRRGVGHTSPPRSLGLLRALGVEGHVLGAPQGHEHRLVARARREQHRQAQRRRQHLRSPRRLAGRTLAIAAADLLVAVGLGLLGLVVVVRLDQRAAGPVLAGHEEPRQVGTRRRAVELLVHRGRPDQLGRQCAHQVLTDLRGGRQRAHGDGSPDLTLTVKIQEVGGSGGAAARTFVVSLAGRLHPSAARHDHTAAAMDDPRGAGRGRIRA
jgi:hypothetical protein